MRVKMFGIPEILVDEKSVSVSLKKAEAMIYYILCQKKTTRNDLRNMFWIDNDDTSAKKNVRNAIYLVKKQFGEDFLLTPNNSNVELNPKYYNISDVAEFENSKKYELYVGQFLKGFSFKDDEMFIEWVQETDNNLHSEYLRILEEEIGNIELSDDVNSIEICNRYLSENRYDEDIAITLMKLHAKKNDYTMVTEVYNNIAKYLENDLGVSINNETKSVYSEIIKKRKKTNELKKTKDYSYFFGRFEEIKVMNTNFEGFINSKDYKHLMVMGEAGIGKTRLVEKALIKYQKKCKTIISKCYYMENDLPFRAWHQILKELIRFKTDKLEEKSGLLLKGMISANETWKGNFNEIDLEGEHKLNYSELLEETSDLLKTINDQGEKIVIVIEDIHWAHPNSIELLIEVIREKFQNIMFVLTSRDYDLRTVENLNTYGIKGGWLTNIKLNRFTENEAREFIFSGIDIKNCDKEIVKKSIDDIYTESEGNTYILKEMLNHINGNGELDKVNLTFDNLLNTKLFGLSKRALKLLDVMALFSEHPFYDSLKELFVFDDMELVEVIEELKKANIIREVFLRDVLVYEFSHQKLKDFIQTRISETGKLVLHRKIAKYYEDTYKKYNDNMSLLPFVVFHYKSAKDNISSYKYQVTYAKMYLDIWHEVFAASSETNNKKDTFENVMLEEIEEIRKKIINVDDEILKYDNILKYIYARKNIREGNYESGTTYLKDAELYFKTRYDKDMYKSCLMQRIHLSIQLEQPEDMNKTLNVLYEDIKNTPTVETEFVFRRLSGLYYKMTSDYETALERFNLAVEYLTPRSGEDVKHSLNLAATYNYMAEVYISKKEYEEAKELLNTAIELGKRGSKSNGLALILINLSLVNFYENNLNDATYYIDQALDVYDKTSSYWGRGKAEAQKAMLMYFLGNKNGISAHINNARKYSKIMQTPSEIAFVEDMIKIVGII